LELLAAIAEAGDFEDPKLDPIYDEAIRDTIRQFAATGSPLSDGEQRKDQNFWTYSVHGLHNTAPDGFKIPFCAGHVRRMPRLTAGPLRYRLYADRHLDVVKRYAHVPLKQAVRKRHIRGKTTGIERLTRGGLGWHSRTPEAVRRHFAGSVRRARDRGFRPPPFKSYFNSCLILDSSPAACAAQTLLSASPPAGPRKGPTGQGQILIQPGGQS